MPLMIGKVKQNKKQELLQFLKNKFRSFFIMRIKHIIVIAPLVSCSETICFPTAQLWYYPIILDKGF